MVRDYPPIRVWGTIGFIAALWTTSLLKLETSAGQFYVASAASLVLGLYAFTLPQVPAQARRAQSRSLVDALGLTSFTLFRDRNMAVFFIFAMLLGAALQLTNAYGDTFLHDFANVDAYKDLLAVSYPAIIMSISQISETLFILAIPFFLKRFGIKTVMTISMLAWFLRFGLFAYGDPGRGLWMIVAVCIVYGMAFDFFNISGSLFVETQSDPTIRASAQGLFMLMTNGVGAVLGSLIAGFVIDHFFTGAGGSKDWHGIWTAFALYSLAMAVLFVPLFKHRHDPHATRACRRPRHEPTSATHEHRTDQPHMSRPAELPGVVSAWSARSTSTMSGASRRCRSRRDPGALATTAAAPAARASTRPWPARAGRRQRTFVARVGGDPGGSCARACTATTSTCAMADARSPHRHCRHLRRCAGPQQDCRGARRECLLEPEFVRRAGRRFRRRATSCWCSSETIRRRGRGSALASGTNTARCPCSIPRRRTPLSTARSWSWPTS